MPLSIVDQKPPLAVDAGGTVRIAGTRVSLDSIVACYKSGATSDQIAEDFPTVGLANIHATIAYYLNNRTEVERYLGEQLEAAEAVKRELGAVVVTDLRERLIARRDSGGA
jgi:uncharacterized protein (DUF433 family)